MIHNRSGVPKSGLGDYLGYLLGGLGDHLGGPWASFWTSVGSFLDILKPPESEGTLVRNSRHLTQGFDCLQRQHMQVKLGLA